MEDRRLSVRGDGGFTLLEVLISLVILGFTLLSAQAMLTRVLAPVMESAVLRLTAAPAATLVIS